MTDPTNNDWRLAGAFGIEPDPTDSNIQEVITQGIGFPLRPVSGVPRTIQPEIPPGALAIGVPLQWMGAWDSGSFYPQGSFVNDGLWTAIANKLTLSRPSPEPIVNDPPTHGLPSFSPAMQTNSSVVLSTHTVVFSKDGWAKELRVWVPAAGVGISYSLVVTNITDPENPIAINISLPALTAGQWTDVGQLNKAIIAGDEYVFKLESINATTDTQINGNWFFLGTSLDQTTSGDLETWSVTSEQDVFRVHGIDANQADRLAELLLIVPSSIVNIEQLDNAQNTVSYRIETIEERLSSYIKCDVTLLDLGNIGPDVESLCSLNIVVPNASGTQYSEQVGGFTVLPNWATSIEGSLMFNGVDQGVPTTNAYGVDILFEPAIVSIDWDIVSYSGE